jgi:hypothetical protein
MDNPTGKKKDKPHGKPAGQDSEIPIHPLIAKLGDDFDDLKDLVFLEGYLGPSKQEGYVRLYPSLDFRTYFEIPADALVPVKTAESASETEPLTYVVDKETKLECVVCIEASFLQGEVTSCFPVGHCIPTCCETTLFFKPCPGGGVSTKYCIGGGVSTKYCIGGGGVSTKYCMGGGISTRCE